jgi:hypothetical protein
MVTRIQEHGHTNDAKAIRIHWDMRPVLYLQRDGWAMLFQSIRIEVVLCRTNPLAKVP